MIRLWDNAWAEFIPLLDYDVEIRRVICSTDEISSTGTGFGGIVWLPVRDEDLVGAFGLLDRRGFGGPSLLVVVGRVRGAEVSAP